MRCLAANFNDLVLKSHGTHIPEVVRNCATVLFWLPDMLFDLRVAAGTLAKDSLFWIPRLACLPDVRDYVARQLTVFNWPPLRQMEDQYMDLMKLWAGFCQNEQHADIQQLVIKDGRFDWEAWWRFVHTDARTCPEGDMAVFMLWHFTGSFGVSEAKAESVASLLKHYGKHSNTKVTIEKTLIKDAGICGDGNDDEFLLSCWYLFFGESSADTFRFNKTRASRCYRGTDRSVTLTRAVRKISLKRASPNLRIAALKSAQSMVVAPVQLLRERSVSRKVSASIGGLVH
eukprot:10925138-Karenia_brevis.AAC.1